MVHGDAKPANFCFAPKSRGVATVDFQYVGGGCGIKDVAYLLAGSTHAHPRRELDSYFAELRKALRENRVDSKAVEAEWRELYSWAWADFHRFLAGWAPSWRIRKHEQAMTNKVLADC